MSRPILALVLTVLAAGDASALWEPVPDPEDLESLDIFLASEESLYAGGFTSRIYASDDHGDTWTEIAGGFEEDYAPIWSMLVVDDWFIMSRDFFETFNFRSQRVDGQWQPWESLPVQEGRISDLCAAGASIFGLFYSGVIHRSDDHGLSWTPVPVPGGGGAGKIFVEDGRLFACENLVNEGRIWRSDDLGASWIEIGAELGSSYISAEVLWQGRLLLSAYHHGGDGSLWSSTDYGDSWTRISTLPTDDNINGLAVSDDGRLAIGDSSGYGGESLWLSADLVEWENFNAGLGSYAGSVNTLQSHDGWFFKTGGVQQAYRARHPESTGAGDAPAFAGALSAWPNPFNPRTTLRFALESAGPALLEVFDPAGRRVAEVFRGELAAGEHEYPWRAEGLASGVYLARLSTDGHRSAEKLVLLQ